MPSNLTRGAVKNILKEKKVNKPTLQYLGYKKIQHFSTKNRYRVLISDGEMCHPFALFSSNLNHLIEEGKIYKYATFVLEEYITDSTKFNTLAIIDIELKDIPNELVPHIKSLTLGDICPIKNIKTEGIINQNIIVRVNSKSPIFYYNKGQGSYCLLELIDSTGCIDLLAFDKNCTKCYSMMEFGKVYLLSNIRTRENSRQHFSPESHRYQLIFELQTNVEPWIDDAVPKINYNCMTFDNLCKLTYELMTDAIGIVKQNSIQSTSNGQYRQIILADNSSYTLNVKLWNQWCDQLQCQVGDILYIKNAKLKRNNGISVEADKNSTVVLNPDIPELKNLETVPYHQPLGCVRLVMIKNNEYPWMTIAEVLTYMESNSKLNFKVAATIMTARKYDCFYKACDRCMKRLVEQAQGYWCTKCKINTTTFYWNCVLRMEISDATGILDVICFETAIEQLLGVPPKALAYMKRNNLKKKLKKYFNKLDYDHLVFKVTTQTNTFKEEEFLRSVVVSTSPPDTKDYGKQLLDQIGELGRQKGKNKPM